MRTQAVCGGHSLPAVPGTPLPAVVGTPLPGCDGCWERARLESSCSVVAPREAGRQGSREGRAAARRHCDWG